MADEVERARRAAFEASDRMLSTLLRVLTYAYALTVEMLIGVVVW